MNNDWISAASVFFFFFMSNTQYTHYLLVIRCCKCTFAEWEICIYSF